MSKEQKITQLKKKLEDIDKKSIRPLRAVNSEIINEADIEKLRRLEEESQKIRHKIALLTHDKDKEGAV